MDFGLTEEQEMLQETVRSFVDNECPPARLREIFDANSGHDDALWRGLVEMASPVSSSPRRMVAPKWRCSTSPSSRMYNADAPTSVCSDGRQNNRPPPSTSPRSDRKRGVVGLPP